MEDEEGRIKQPKNEYEKIKIKKLTQRDEKEGNKLVVTSVENWGGERGGVLRLNKTTILDHYHDPISWRPVKRLRRRTLVTTRCALAPPKIKERSRAHRQGSSSPQTNPKS